MYNLQCRMPPRILTIRPHAMHARYTCTLCMHTLNSCKKNKPELLNILCLAWRGGWRGGGGSKLNHHHCATPERFLPRQIFANRQSFCARHFCGPRAAGRLGTFVEASASKLSLSLSLYRKRHSPSWLRELYLPPPPFPPYCV